MTSANAGSRAVRATIGRESVLLAVNAASCVLVFVAVWLPLHLPSSERPSEVIERVAITCVYYVPILFVLLYLPIRTGMAWSADRLVELGLRRVVWLIGAFLGGLLAIADTYTRFFWVLNPVLESLGL